MQDKEWIDRWHARLRAQPFTQAVNDHLDAIQEAESVTELGRRLGQFGGYLRRQRERTRLDLTEALIKELAVTPTFHVARMLMVECFGKIVHNEALVEWFALPGRTHDTQHLMDLARHALAKHPHARARYRGLHDYYGKALKLRVKEIKLARKSRVPR